MHNCTSFFFSSFRIDQRSERRYLSNSVCRVICPAAFPFGGSNQERGRNGSLPVTREKGRRFEYRRRNEASRQKSPPVQWQYRPLWFRQACVIYERRCAAPRELNVLLRARKHALNFQKNTLPKKM